MNSTSLHVYLISTILPIILAKGFTPIFSAILAVIKTTAAAPSFNVLAFAAVIVPKKN